MKVFINFISAATYDEICNQARITQSDPNEEYPLWHGNMQAIPALVIAPMHARKPEMTVQEGIIRLVDTRDHIEQRAAFLLDEQGCDSQQAAAMRRQLAYFTRTPPETVFDQIAKKVEEEGGTMSEFPQNIPE